MVRAHDSLNDSLHDSIHDSLHDSLPELTPEAGLRQSENTPVKCGEGPHPLTGVHLEAGVLGQLRPEVGGHMPGLE